MKSMLEADPLTATWHFILPQGSGARVLMIETQLGWSLPSVVGQKGALPEIVGSITRGVAQQLGINVTVLRHLHGFMLGGGLQICELENHEWEWTPPANGRWMSHED